MHTYEEKTAVGPNGQAAVQILYCVRVCIHELSMPPVR